MGSERMTEERWQSAISFFNRGMRIEAIVAEGERARAAESALAADNERLREAAHVAVEWMWDPDDGEQYERIAAEFLFQTRYMRPGKDDRRGIHSEDERFIAWNRWREDRARKVLADSAPPSGASHDQR